MNDVDAVYYGILGGVVALRFLVNYRAALLMLSITARFAQLGVR